LNFYQIAKKSGKEIEEIAAGRRDGWLLVLLAVEWTD
jgi:hypothetical protein